MGQVQVFHFLTFGIFSHLFPSASLWRWGGSLGLSRGRTSEAALGDPTDASSGLGLGVPSCLWPLPSPPPAPCPHFFLSRFSILTLKESALLPPSLSCLRCLHPTPATIVFFPALTWTSVFGPVGGLTHTGDPGRVCQGIVKAAPPIYPLTS